MKIIQVIKITRTIEIDADPIQILEYMNGEVDSPSNDDPRWVSHEEIESERVEL